jgi:hypothetical protein
MLKSKSVLRVESDLGGATVTYPPELLPALQSVLRILADLAFEHEGELEQLSASGAHPELKRQIRTRLEEAYARRRAPYLRHFSDLQSQALASLPAPEEEVVRRRFR